MFRIGNSKQVQTDLPVIVDGYEELLFDGVPILFAGTNRYGNQILASSVEEDFRRKLARFFHVIIDQKTFSKFKSGKITYASIMQEAGLVYILDVKMGEPNSPPVIYSLNYSEIPSDLRPHRESYCPPLSPPPKTLSYALRLAGGLADSNAILPDDMIEAGDAFSDMLRKPIQLLADMNLTPLIKMKPSAAGSHVLNFEIEVQHEDGQQMLFSKGKDFADFVEGYLEYCTNDLADEATDLLAYPASNMPKKFANFASSYLFLRESLGLQSTDPAEDTEGLIKSIYASSQKLSDLTEDIGFNFSRMSLEMKTSKRKAKTLSVIERADAKRIQSVAETIEAERNPIEVDKKAQDYEIQIYHLNLVTRKGNAYTQSGDVRFRPKIEIGGVGSLEGTKFSASLHTGEVITVKARARRAGQKILRLLIEEEL